MGKPLGLCDPVVHNLGGLAPQGTSGDTLVSHGAGATGTWWVEAGMLPSTLQCRGRPHSRESSGPDARNSGLGLFLSSGCCKQPTAENRFRAKLTT